MNLELNFSEWLLFEGKNPIRQGEIEIYGDTYNRKEDIKRVTHGRARYSGERTWYVPADYRKVILSLGGLMVSGDPTPQQRPQLQHQSQIDRPQLTKPKSPQTPPTLTTTTTTKPKWFYAKVLRADPRFPEGKEIAVTPANKDKTVWEYVVLDKRFSRRFGTITKEEIDGGLIKTVRRDDKAVSTEKPNFKDFRKAFNIPEEKPQRLQEIPEHMLSDEQKQIDKKFAFIMKDDKQNHIVISALAGTGKTTCLKHLAWKYAKTGQRWLYLVFNTKNKVEAKEPGEFPPQPIVTIKTTNGFLGNVIEGTEPGTEANKLKLKQTERDVDIVKGLRKEDNEEQDEKKLEKIRIISDGSQFEAILLDKTKAPKGYDASDDYDKWVAKAVNARIKQIRYLFKEESIRLANLAKSYAVDPRDQQKTMQLLETILDEHNIDVTFIDEKVKISKYRGNMPRYVTNALRQILGYDFMQKNYSEEIKYAAYWLLQQSMPGVSSQEYQRGGIAHPMGNFRDFSDDIWFASTYADEIDWPKYDVVLADEVQDFNESQKIMLKKLGEQGAKIVAVGDKNQCHPAGTMISLTGGGSKPIEEIKPGDELVTYNSKKSYFPGTAAQGRKVLETSSRIYDGPMIEIITPMYVQKCTTNHKCLVRLAGTGKYCLYLMVKENSARIGICRLNYINGFGLPIRAKQEGAEKAWLLNIYDLEEDARIAESVLSAKFGLPQVIFTNKGQITPSQRFINEVYKQIGNNIQNAIRCLEYFGREWDFPLWTKEKQERFGKLKQNYICSKKSFMTQACNLISNYMEVRTFDGTNRGGNWEKIQIKKTNTQCIVYSLSVEPTEDNKRIYIANNIVTFNSIYRFRGADSEAFDNLSSSLAHWSSNKDDVVQTISDNFRSKQAIIDKSNTTHVQNLKKSNLKNYDEEGHVTEGEKKYEEAFGDIKKEFDVTGEIKTTAFISRTNEPLIHAALQLLKRSIPFVILGKDIAGGLKKHIAKISAFKGVNDSSECGELQSQLEGYLNQESDLYHGAAVKRGYLQELKEVTEAIISSISQFLEEREGINNTVGSFKKWIMDKLGKATLDFDTGNEQAKERDYAKYKKKMEEETPPVVLTTSHKSKGLQFSRVYILRYDLFPHPKTRKDREKEMTQEENARYVSITRAQDELHILDLEGQPGYKKKQGNAMEWTEWFRLRETK